MIPRTTKGMPLLWGATAPSSRLAGQQRSILLNQSRTFIRIPRVRLFVVKNHTPPPSEPDFAVPPGFSQPQQAPPELAAKTLGLNETVAELRHTGRLSPYHFQFPFDAAHCELDLVRRGPSLADHYGKLHWRSWVQSSMEQERMQQGNEFSQNAFTPLQSILQVPDGSLLKLAQTYTETALNGLSYSPKHHCVWESSPAMTQLYTTTLKQAVFDCISVLKNNGDLGLQIDVHGTFPDPLTCDRDHYVLLGDRTKIESSNLLDPRVAILQNGRTLVLCDLKHDMDTVPLDRQQVTRTQGNGMQYIVDVNVVAYGEAVVYRVAQQFPAAAPVAASAPVKRTTVKKQLTRSKAPHKPLPKRATIDDKTILVKYPFVKPVLLRLASNVFAPDEYKQFAHGRGLSWKVADIDYMVTSRLWERGRKLAPLLADR